MIPPTLLDLVGAPTSAQLSSTTSGDSSSDRVKVDRCLERNREPEQAPGKGMQRECIASRGSHNSITHISAL
ncbi:hypothetical protein Mapa_016196 [Marchantia paleacea]|nr:hypothetical protein Mapa_016196 [Marchantia paleacea]